MQLEIKRRASRRSSEGALALGGGGEGKVQLAKDGHVPRAPIMAGRRADARQKNRLRAECRRERAAASPGAGRGVADRRPVSLVSRDVALRSRSIRERGIIWIVGALFGVSARETCRYRSRKTAEGPRCQHPQRPKRGGNNYYESRSTDQFPLINAKKRARRAVQTKRRIETETGGRGNEKPHYFLMHLLIDQSRKGSTPTTPRGEPLPSVKPEPEQFNDRSARRARRIITTPRLSREIFLPLSSPLRSAVYAPVKGARTSLRAKGARSGARNDLSLPLSPSGGLERSSEFDEGFPGIGLRAYDGKKKRGRGKEKKVHLRSRERTSEGRIAPLSRASFRPNAATARRFRLKMANAKSVSPCRSNRAETSERAVAVAEGESIIRAADSLKS